MAILDNNVTLYMNGGYGLDETSSLTLFSYGHYEVNALVELSTTGAFMVNNNATLFIDAVGTIEAVRPLYIEGHKNELNSTIDLFLQEGTAGTFAIQDSITLYIPPPEYNSSATLFLFNDEPFAVSNTSRTLYLEVDDAFSDSSFISLFLKNLDIDSGISLYVSGEGLFNGFITNNKSMPLFINRPDESTSMPLFCKAVDNTVNSYVSLYTLSFLTEDNNITLTVPDAHSPLNSTMTMFVEGAVLSNGNITLHEHGYGTLNDNIELFCKQGNTALNAICSLYTFGANLDSSSITLSIPSTYDTVNDGNVPLYVFGW